MKVVFVYGAYPPIPDGGAGFLKNLADTLLTLGVKISVITSNQLSTAPHWSSHNGIRVYPAISDWGISKKNFRELKDIFHEIQPDIIHTIFPCSSVGIQYQSPMLIKFASPKPLITTLYGFSFLSGNLWSRLAIVALLHFSDYLTSDNDFVIGAIRRYLPYLRKKLYYVPSGSNISNEPIQRYNKLTLRAQYGFNHNAYYICHFGYLDMTRNIESLFLAVKIQRDRGIDLRIIMVGGNPFKSGKKRYEELSDLIRSLGLDPYVIWTGFSSEEQIAHYFICSDLCVLPFRRNTTGRSSLPAALSFGLPVITTCHTKTLFSLRDHENVILVPPDDVKGLSEAIGELIDDSALRQRLAEAALKLWKENFSFDVIGRQTLNIYQRLIDKNNK